MIGTVTLEVVDDRVFPSSASKSGLIIDLLDGGSSVLVLRAGITITAKDGGVEVAHLQGKPGGIVRFLDHISPPGQDPVRGKFIQVELAD